MAAYHLKTGAVNLGFEVYDHMRSWIAIISGIPDSMNKIQSINM